MTFFRILSGILGRYGQRRRAKKELKLLFSNPSRLAGTSLKPSHFGRCDVMDIEMADKDLVAIVFQIIRHPRPHPFSRQHHLVAERWRVDLLSDTVERAGSVNLSRLRGEDGDPPGSFP
ncbi:MAG TPA: hypothetical protein DGU45_03220 [Planctomycetes bacterium]|nr:hypothetical protein [Planctomycetota bacterium]HCW44305.1 hypothetical protein [Planctomycetota bacterium]